MKKSLMQTLLSLSLLCGAAISANAQHLEPAAEPYWVVESNVATKKSAIVRFYNRQHELVYEEKLEGVKLDIRKKKVVRMLNRLLQNVVGNTLLASQRRSF